MKKRLFHRVAAAVLLSAAIFFFGCNVESADDYRSPYIPHTPSVSDIELYVGIGGKSVPIADFVKTGIPYTATSHDVNPSEKLTLTAVCKDSSIDSKTVTAEIAEPAENPPLTIGKIPDSNLFEVKLTPVTEATAVKIAFTAKDGKAEKTISFKVLPEPAISAVTHTPSALNFGKNIFYTLKPKIICEQDDFGGIPAENFILPPHKTFSYASSNDSAVFVSSAGELHAKEVGESDVTISVGGKSCTLKVTVVDKTAPHSLNFDNYFDSDIAVNLKEYETKTLTVKTYTTGADITLSDWINSNPAVGKIETLDAASGTYKLTALSEGVTEFTSAAKYNPGAALKIKLTVSWRTVESVSVKPSSVYLIVGGDKRLKAEVEPSYGAPKGVTWKSLNEEIATVDENGVITAHKNGTTFITARSAADSLKSATCSVTVSDAPESVTLNKTGLELNEWDTAMLTALVSPSTASQAVEWSSDKSYLVEVSSSGLVSSQGSTRKAIVTAASKFDPSKKAECAVYVVTAKVASLSLSESAITMNTEDTESFTLTVSPSNATLDSEYEIEGDNLEITKFSRSYSNTYSCTVKSGKRAETKKITFKSKANPEKQAVLTVTTKVPPVASVTINEKNKVILTGQTGEKLTATVFPAGAVQTVKWTSDNPAVVAIDESTGVLTPAAKGSATITAESTADTSKKDTATVTVSEGITAITSLTADKTFAYYGGDVNLTATLTPADAHGDLEWSCNNSSCSVTKDSSDEKKAVLAVTKQNAKEGKVTVTVQSRIKPELKKELTLDVRTVIPQSISISTSDPADKMYKEQYLQLTVTAVSKYGATGPAASTEVEWKIKDQPLWNSNYVINNENELLCTWHGKSSVNNGDKVTVVAASALDDSVKAEKEITVYDNIAKLASVYCEYNYSHNPEWTLGNSTYPTVKGSLSVSNAYPHFIITEKSDGTPSSDFLETTEYAYPSDGSVTIKPKAHTSGAAQTFYVFPVDPKTGNAATAKGQTFTLTVWQKATGIEVTKGDGTECDKDSNGDYKFSINRKSNSPDWSVRVSPKFAKPQELNYSISGDTNIDGNTYAYFTNWKYKDGKNTFTINTHDIGLLFGNKSSTATFTSNTDSTLSRKLNITIIK
ncbi:MAG: Ig-like domain-containing protein [Treponema sp.]